LTRKKKKEWALPHINPKYDCIIKENLSLCLFRQKTPEDYKFLIESLQKNAVMFSMKKKDL